MRRVLVASLAVALALGGCGDDDDGDGGPGGDVPTMELEPVEEEAEDSTAATR